MMGEAPERVWLSTDDNHITEMVKPYGMWHCEKQEAHPDEVEYIRADLYDAANQNEADAIAAYGDLMIKFAALERENERLRMESDSPCTVHPDGSVYTPWGYAK